MNVRKDKITVSETLMQQLSDYLSTRIGLHFAKKDWKDLQRKISVAMADFGFDHIEGFIEWLLDNLSLTQNQVEILASHLTVGETYFFRERQAFETLRRVFLPELVRARRNTDKRLRFWSAGCSTGEEPYSVAVLLDRLIPDLKNWNVTILATDINTGALRKAENGIYSDWSFRENPPWFKANYFEHTGGNNYRLSARIRNMVTFSYLNLSEDRYPALQNNTNAMDFILCRNVMMYFSAPQTRLTVDRFHRSLIDGGWLIISPVETGLMTHSAFTAVRIQDSTFYKKEIQRPQLAEKRRTGKENIRIPLKRHAIPKQRRPEKTMVRFNARVEPEGAEKVEQSAFEAAVVCYEKGLYPEAEQKLRKLLSNGGGNQDVCVLFTKVLANQGKLDEARGFCEGAVTADKCNAHLHYLLATILQEQKKGEEARVSLKKALYLDRNFIPAHFALGNLSLRSGNTADARKHFRNIIEILSDYQPDQIIPESDGITAGRLSEIIASIRIQEM